MPWFLHKELAVTMLGAEVAMGLPYVPDSHPFAKGINNDTLCQALWDATSDRVVPSGASEIMAGRLRAGDLTWFDDTFWFKDVAKSFESGSPDGARFHNKLDLGHTVSISGRFNAARITSDTSFANLKGRSPVFILGYATSVGADEVTLRPIVIATLLYDRPGVFPILMREKVRLWPQEVAEFVGVDFDKRLFQKDLEVLKGVPEDRVKHAFANILGEPETPKDWGGEQFDLWTDRITVNGERYQAAIAFKGPAKFHPMTIADLGKNGDQIDRLANTAADVLIVQHCHSVRAPVVNMLRTYAVQPGRTRRYMVIDGYDTIRILSHFGHL